MFVTAGLIILDRTGLVPTVRLSTNQLYRWGVILSAIVLLLGLLNVGWLHLGRILDGKRYWIHSAALLAAMLAVLVAGLLNPAGVASPMVEWVFDSIIAPGQATLFALLAFFMAGAAFVYLRADRTGGGWMLLGALLVLTAQAPVARVWMAPNVNNLAAWALQVPGMATMRGALIGSAVALILVGVRYLFKAR